MEKIYSVVSKKTSIFEPFLLFFEQIEKNFLEFFQKHFINVHILKYIGRVKSLAEKNLKFFRKVRAIKLRAFIAFFFIARVILSHTNLSALIKLYRLNVKQSSYKT